MNGAWSAASAAIAPFAPVTKTIEIASRKRIDIYAEGVITRFAAGTKRVPQYRFSGQRGATSGTARPEVDEDWLFTSTRKAGRRIVVRFTTESGDVRSEPVKIPARPYPT